MDEEQRRIIGREIKRSMRIDSCGSSTGGGAVVMGSDVDDSSVGSSISVGDSNGADEEGRRKNKRKGAGDDSTSPSVYLSTASSSSPTAAAASGASAHYAKTKIRRRSPAGSAAGRVGCRRPSSTPAKPGASLTCPPCKRTADFPRNSGRNNDIVRWSKARKTN